MKITSPKMLAVWARKNTALGLKVAAAMAYAEVERERVDAYEKPIYDSYQFRDENGELVPYKNWLGVNDDRINDFFERMKDVHVEHGWKGDRDYHPALVAENALIEAENELLRLGAVEVMGIDPDSLIGSRLDLRKKAIDMLLGMLLSAVKKSR